MRCFQSHDYRLVIKSGFIIEERKSLSDAGKLWLFMKGFLSFISDITRKAFYGLIPC